MTGQQGHMLQIHTSTSTLLSDTVNRDQRRSSLCRWVASSVHARVTSRLPPGHAGHWPLASGPPLAPREAPETEGVLCDLNVHLRRVAVGLGVFKCQLTGRGKCSLPGDSRNTPTHAHRHTHVTHTQQYPAVPGFSFQHHTYFTRLHAECLLIYGNCQQEQKRRRF